MGRLSRDVIGRTSTLSLGPAPSPMPAVEPSPAAIPSAQTGNGKRRVVPWYIVPSVFSKISEIVPKDLHCGYGEGGAGER